MQCCVPFCKYTSENISTSEVERKGISFHSFPSEVHLCAAWLRALGKQDSSLTDSDVVCSQHFLNDDIYETETGLRQIVAGAIPSTVQVCMICLDTDSKLILITKHKLEETFEKLMGHPLCDRVNLKPTLCVQCAQRLINFSKFRDKSFRARALMMDLVEKHELITRQHIKMINRTKHQLKSSMVLTTLGPDHCDLHILEHPSEDKLTELEETHHSGVVKTEESDDCMSVDGDVEVIHEEDNNINDFVQETLKYESAPFQCTLCLEEFIHEHAYMQHMTMHLQNGDGGGECDTSQVCKPHTAVSSSSSHSSLTENKQADPSPSAQAAQTTVSPPSTSLVINRGIKVPPTEEVDTNISCRYKRLPDCFVKLYDIFAKRAVQRQDGSLMETQRDVMSCDSLNTVSKDFSHQATSQNEVPMTEYIEPVTDQSEQSTHMRTDTGEKPYSCKICDYKCRKSGYLVRHMKLHTAEKTYVCKICNKSFACDNYLVLHMRTHTGEKPHTCKICNRNFARPNTLHTHMRTHTGENKFSCKLCDFKCRKNSYLVRHMKTHTAEETYVCKICNKNFARESYLVLHMRTHTGEKPHTCKICNRKFARPHSLHMHMRTHTGIKPYACDLCGYTFAAHNTLVHHKRTHTGEKPYSCEICDYKCAYKGGIKTHMLTHTGEKPFSCKLCNRKFGLKRHLVQHVRTHTGEKPFSCKICDSKFALHSTLMGHMTTHPGEKRFSCDLCDYKCTLGSLLTRHLKTHVAIKPYSCELCDHKAARKADMELHMRTHMGEKPFSCELCKYKHATKQGLVVHMTTHTGEKPFTCLICNSNFTRNSSLLRHMRSHTSK